MTTDLPIRCACGTLRGFLRGVSPSRGNRAVCYCADCQSFAHFLGRADEMLNASGGTDIFQTSPARVEITHGRERLALMRLTPKGLFRWYASCCQTPIGNTAPTAAIPFVGLITRCLDLAPLGLDRDQALGPVRGHVNTTAAKPDASGNKIRQSGIAASITRFARVTLHARLRGDQKRNLFFDPSGQPSVTARVLTADELADVVRRRDAR